MAARDTFQDTFADGDRVADAVRQAFAGQDAARQGEAIVETLALYRGIIAGLDARVNALESRLAEISAPEGRLPAGEGPALRG